ncbi:hypothetical protein R1flu_000837 [Riccia fluitans]|uniref:Uncharacterized protein n=1 Tax=Riccia fluitans TaxID=41844 RepID=A0ABD1Y4I4_9MARC
MEMRIKLRDPNTQSFLQGRSREICDMRLHFCALHSEEEDMDNPLPGLRLKVVHLMSPRSRVVVRFVEYLLPVNLASEDNTSRDER